MKWCGVYKNLCCGSEIVIPENVVFPDCAVHINFPRNGKTSKRQSAFHVNELLSKQNERDPAA
jgi:hypothetical protein